jgi:H+-translocating NAD(P) transhydrogenase
MNRSLTNVLFGGINTPAATEGPKIEGTITKASVDDAVDALSNAENVILVSTMFMTLTGHKLRL